MSKAETPKEVLERAKAMQQRLLLYFDDAHHRREPLTPLVQDLTLLHADMDRLEVTEENELLRQRCGWCGVYKGEVDPFEPCARDHSTGEFIGPHQFGIVEPVGPAALVTMKEPRDKKNAPVGYDTELSERER